MTCQVETENIELKKEVSRLEQVIAELKEQLRLMLVKAKE